MPRKIKGCKTNSKGMVVQGNHKQYVFRTEDPTEAGDRAVEDWIHCINANLGPDTAFADLYTNRRRTLVTTD